MKKEEKVIRDKFFAFLSEVSLSSDMDRSRLHLGRIYGHNHLFLGWPSSPYLEVVEAVQSVYPEISSKTIGKLLVQSMVKLFESAMIRDDADPEADAPELTSVLLVLDSKEIREEISSFLNLLESHIKPWSVFVFLEGVELKGLVELPLGVATLYPTRRGPLLDVLEEMKAKEDLRKAARHIEKDIREFAGHCCCYLNITVEGEDKFADQKALEQAREIANVLNLYMVSSQHRTSFYQSIGVLGQPTVTRYQLVLKRTPPVGERASAPVYLSGSQFPPMRRYEIDSAKIKHWKEHGLNQVLNCIGLADFRPNSVESRIHNAIAWYGRAMNAYSPDEQFVGLVIALESLLIADEEVSITQRLADAVSILVGSDFESRKGIELRVRELYKLRCKIVHTGFSISPKDLFDLDWLVVNAILAVVRREMPI